VSAYSLVALARAVMPAMTEGGSISTSPTSVRSGLCRTTM